MKFVPALLLPVLSLARTELYFGEYFLDAFIDPTDADFAIFQIDMPAEGWFGLGLGSKDMSKNTDMIMIDAVAETVFDMYSVGNRTPLEDDF